MHLRPFYALMLVFAARAGGAPALAEDAAGALPAIADGKSLTPPAVSFELDVMPILTARGCNQGACHGKARGQNGFQLSLLGFDSDFDYASLTRLARGRRVFPASPERSLVLLKGSAQLPHGGGVRIEADGEDYRTLLAWIAQGAVRRLEGEPTLTRIAVSPTERFMKPNEE